MCPDGFFAEVELTSIGMTDVDCAQDFSFGVTTLDGLKTKSMPQKICQFSPSWIVDCQASHREVERRVALLVTWSGDLAIFIDGELQS